MIITNEAAKVVLHFLLTNFEGESRYDVLPVAGYFLEEGRYTCFDNRGYSCYVEQTKDVELARKWCSGKIDATELYWPNHFE